MGSSVNKVILVGRLGKDPEIRYTQGGTAVASFSIATDESYKDKTSGNKIEKTEWHRLVVWGPSVEAFVQKYLHKGDLIYVEGKLQTREWEDKQSGQKRSTTEINVSDIKSLMTKDAESPAETKSNGTKARPAPAATEVADDDIPF